MKVPVLCVLMLVAISDAALDFGYHDQQALEQFLNETKTNYSAITDLYTIGKSVLGVNLWVLAIGESPKEHVLLRPNVKYVANMHGNEVTGREILLHLIEHLVTNYGINDTITHFLNTTTVHIMPTMNPDGFAISNEGDCSGNVGRYNNNSLDLNRNFPDYFAENKAPLQPETLSVMKWIADIPFVLSSNIHGGIELVNYPWDSYPDAHNESKYSESPDDDVFRHISKVYSYSHHTMFRGEACPNRSEEFPDGITNGAEWYPVTGGMQDYHYVNASCMEVLVEMTCCKYPPRDDLPTHWGYNRDALIHYLMEVHRGVKGLVTDVNNNPIAGASLSVEGRNEIVFRTTSQGEYWRILLPGDYTFQFTASGFTAVSEKVTVVEGEVTRLDVKLAKTTTGTIESAGCLQSPSSWISFCCLFFLYTSKFI